jgi:imidazolonepropionase
MSSLEIKRGVNIAIEGGKITYVGSEFVKANEYVDGSQLVVIPGFVDCHTHIPFVGSRSDEFIMRLSGKSYMDIMNAGGGIRSTVREVRSAPASRIVAESMDTLTRCFLLELLLLRAKAVTVSTGITNSSS